MMRKLLLASAAMLGGTMGLAGVASAQGMLSTTTGVGQPASPTPLAIKGNPGSQGTEIPGFGPPLSPGSVTVRLGGRLVGYAGIASDTGRNPGFINGTKKLPGTAANTKLAPEQFGEYARLYPSVDGMAANGLKYGAFLEVRSDVSAAPGGGGNGSIGAQRAVRGELYWQRETVYVGSDQFGFVRIGATDQPTSLFATGTFENFDDGAWNSNISSGSSGAFPATTNSTPTGPFPDVSALYTTTKIVYLSPKFANLVDFGVSFEPNSGGNSPGVGNCPYANTTAAGAGCDATTSTTVSGENKRRDNTVDAVVRLRTAAGPVGIAATFGGFASGAVNYTGGAIGAKQPYTGLAVLDGGAQVTFGGLAIGGHINGGDTNSGWALKPEGGRSYLGWLVGSSYQFGSAVVGVSYFNTQSAGSWTNKTVGVGRSLNQVGVAAGGTLTLAPGLYTFLSYLYGEKHQVGVDEVSGSAEGWATHNTARSQALILGTRVSW